MLDRSVIMRHLEGPGRPGDPFDRTPLTPAMLVPHPELQARIRAFAASARAAAAAAGAGPR